VRRLQRAELFDHQEPEDHDGAVGVEEILPRLPQAHAAQGSEIIAVVPNLWIYEFQIRQSVNRAIRQ
jgi:hypothetical protein